MQKIIATKEDLQVINQIKPMYGHTLSGFAQGEGSFHLVTRKRQDFYYGFRFNIAFSVGNKDRKIISLYKTVLKCGTCRASGMRSGDNFYMFEISSAELIVRRIIPFFKRFGFLNDISASNFSKFSKMATILADVRYGESGERLALEDILELLRLRNQLFNAPKHDRTDLSLIVQIKRVIEDRLYSSLLAPSYSNNDEFNRLEYEFNLANLCIKKMNAQKSLHWTG